MSGENAERERGLLADWSERRQKPSATGRGPEATRTQPAGYRYEATIGGDDENRTRIISLED